MGQIGRFIDHCCEHHPTLMRAVMERPLAPLDYFIRFDDSGGVCGCLIGTAALAAGLMVTRDKYDASAASDAVSVILAPLCALSLIPAADEADYYDDFEYLYHIGIAVSRVSSRLARITNDDIRFGTPASDARTVHLLRTRIARQLAIRESAMPLGNMLPNEPVEVVPSHV